MSTLRGLRRPSFAPSGLNHANGGDFYTELAPGVASRHPTDQTATDQRASGGAGPAPQKGQGNCGSNRDTDRDRINPDQLALSATHCEKDRPHSKEGVGELGKGQKKQ